MYKTTKFANKAKRFAKMLSDSDIIKRSLGES